MKHQRRFALPARLPAATTSRRRLLAGLAAAAVTGPAAARPAPARAARPSRQEIAAADDPFVAKAVYLNPLTDDGYDLGRLLDLIARTELNALVLDVKEDGVYYDTGVALFQDAGVVVPYYDVTEVLDTLRANDVYAIARLVVFKDTLLAEARPDLAVADAATGGIWRDMNGVAWVNPLDADVWAAIGDLAVELAELGFDEVQFDYVRFPTDGDLEAMDFGRDVDEPVRVEAIAGFLAEAGERLAPFGVATSADVFGFTLLLDDIGIGQNVARIGEVVDFVCPMVYPSHFPNGSIAVDGHPNDYPYETIAISLEAGAPKLPGGAAQLRPWLQDFSLPGLSDYGPAEVRAQIDAAEAAGAGGWMIWNAANVYHEASFAPADG